jgi:hypothetical protein
MATPVAAMSHFSYVYTEGSGDFDNLVKAGLACRSLTVNRQPQNIPARAEGAPLRRLIWEPDFEMPDFAQVEVTGGGLDGQRWNVIHESIELIEWLDGSPAFRRAYIVRAL